jgi:hypothetical protein
MRRAGTLPLPHASAVRGQHGIIVGAAQGRAHRHAHAAGEAAHPRAAGRPQDPKLLWISTVGHWQPQEQEARGPKRGRKI